MESTTIPCPRTPNRLRKNPSQERKRPTMPLGVKVKRISDYEPYADRTRGTLGGFMALCDMSSDGGSAKKEKNVEKECVLTQMTKKIGLGIYTRRHSPASGSEQMRKEACLDAEGDDRETWYMFYPPPPSPSLAINPEEWDSGSSTEIDPKSPTGFDFDFKPEARKETPSLQSNPSKESSYEDSRTSSPIGEAAKPTVKSQPVDIDDLVHSAESLANEYRELMSLGTSSPTSISHSTSNAYLMGDKLSYPLPLAISFNLPLPLPLPMPTPKTLRKVKRQHSLRRLQEPSPNNLAASFDLDPSLLDPDETNHGEVAIRTPSPLIISPSPDDVPSPNEPNWIMAPFHPVEAPVSGLQLLSKHSHSSRVQPRYPPPHESSNKHNRHSPQANLNKYQTGEIPPRPSRPPKVRPPLIRRNAAHADAMDRPSEDVSPLKVTAALTTDPLLTLAPQTFPPSPPLSPSTSIGRSKSFILPSVILRRQEEDVSPGPPQPPEPRDISCIVVVEQNDSRRSHSRGQRAREREKRYGIVVPSMAPTTVENGKAGWV